MCTEKPDPSLLSGWGNDRAGLLRFGRAGGAVLVEEPGATGKCSGPTSGALLGSINVSISRQSQSACDGSRERPVNPPRSVVPDVTSVPHIPQTTVEQIQQFFEHFKDLERDKWAEGDRMARRYGSAANSSSMHRGQRADCDREYS